MTKKWPETVDNLVNDLLTRLSEDDKKRIKETPKEDLRDFHFNIGVDIRNTYGLWGTNKKLVKQTVGIFGHPDDVSSIIIEKLWERLQRDN